MADNSKLQTSAHKTQISETQSPHPQNFEVTFELAFGPRNERGRAALFRIAKCGSLMREVNQCASTPYGPIIQEFPSASWIRPAPLSHCIKLLSQQGRR